jgi:mannose-6-phosphate isomerase-like protein (cupin superfamily)
MGVRRVVTGHDANGRATIVSDNILNPVELSLLSGVQIFPLWGSDGPAAYDPVGALPKSFGYFPPPGGARFAITVFPPEAPPPAEVPSPEARKDFITRGVAEAEERLPKFLEFFEPDSPGYHTTDSIDFVYIATGRVQLELTSGEPVILAQGDSVVQNGTRHRWRAIGDEPVTLVAVLLGVER